LTQIFIDSKGIISSTSKQITNLPELSNIEWGSTGIWAEFIEDVKENDLFNDDYIALFIMNDVNSNNIIKIPIRLNIELFNPLDIEENKKELLKEKEVLIINIKKLKKEKYITKIDKIIDKADNKRLEKVFNLIQKIKNKGNVVKYLEISIKLKLWL